MTSQWWPLLTAVSGLLYLYFRIWGGRLLMLPSTKAEYSYVRCVSQNIPTYIHPFNGPLSGSTHVSQYQKGKTIWILLKQEAVSGNGISWAICKFAPCSRQITKPAPHHLVFLQTRCPYCHPANTIKALKAQYIKHHKSKSLSLLQ